MRELFSFIVGNNELSFADLHSNYGMFLQGVDDSGSVAWDIATSKNPYMNGVQVNNRTANAREIVITFGYVGNIEPDEADENLYAFLAPCLNGEKLTLQKRKGYDYKFIDGYIQAINRNIYTDTPTLEIVLLTDSFWRGFEVGDYGALIPALTGYAWRIEGKVQGNIDPESLDFRFTVTQNTQVADLSCYFELNGKLLRFVNEFSIIPATNLTKQVIHISIGDKNIIEAINYNGNKIVSKTNLLRNITSGKFPTLKANKKYIGTFRLSDGGAIINQNGKTSFNYDYTPLYIR